MAVRAFSTLPSSLLRDDFAVGLRTLVRDDSELDRILVEDLACTARRLSRFAKFVTIAGLSCLAKVARADVAGARVGIFLGSAFANQQDSNDFTLLATVPHTISPSPTRFVSCAHNVALAILTQQCVQVGPSHVIMQAGLSFEAALLAAAIALAAKEVDLALVGGADVTMAALATLGGEGATFFALSEANTAGKSLGTIRSIAITSRCQGPFAPALRSDQKDRCVATNGMSRAAIVPDGAFRFMDYQTGGGRYPTAVAFALAKFLHEPSWGHHFLHLSSNDKGWMGRIEAERGG